MELKHKECFCPVFVERFDLGAASRYAREVWEFVNLYSQTRGVNRYQALLRALSLCEEHPEIAAREISVTRLPELERWVACEPKLADSELASAAARSDSKELEQVLEWSREVDAVVRSVVRDLPPFEGVREVIELLDGRADIAVVSQTPVSTLNREWAAQRLDSSLAIILGQESGTKADHLRATAGDASRAAGNSLYPRDHVLMIGDAPGDRDAARETGALFFPVIPGKEPESWERLHSEGIERFFGRTFAGTYQKRLLDEFDTVLPAEPPWENL
jgi:phosphoglycolate phosphatase-like HAD superfamily hydrolase